jgi:hypothetical protein
LQVSWPALNRCSIKAEPKVDLIGCVSLFVESFFKKQQKVLAVFSSILNHDQSRVWESN